MQLMNDLSNSAHGRRHSVWELGCVECRVCALACARCSQPAGSVPASLLLSRRQRHTAVEQDVARADDGSACPGCRTHGRGPGGMPLWQRQSAGESCWARAGTEPRQRGRACGGGKVTVSRLVTQMYHLFTQRAYRNSYNVYDGHSVCAVALECWQHEPSSIHIV